MDESEEKKAASLMAKLQKSGLEARVKESYKLGSVMAFSGVEFSPREWRPVPKGFESAAIVHPLLDVREAETEKEIPVKSQEVLEKFLSDPEATQENPEVLEENPELSEENPESSEENTETLPEEKVRRKRKGKK